jgi:hypothetical protein
MGWQELAYLSGLLFRSAVQSRIAEPARNRHNYKTRQIDRQTFSACLLLAKTRLSMFWGEILRTPGFIELVAIQLQLIEALAHQI